MKNLFLFILFSIFIGFAAQAHPASKVVVSYKDGKLSIEAKHKVKDAADHYIKEVVVYVNGKEYKTLTFTKQASLEMEKIVIDFPEFKEGDVVEVKTTCNKFGTKTGKLTIKKK